jgi:tetratricopeptide (TPR) repeat protein
VPRRSGCCEDTLYFADHLREDRSGPLECAGSRFSGLDPLSFFMNRRLGATLYFARHYDEALKQLARAGEMEPQLHGFVDNYISWTYEAKGMRDEAVAHDLRALRSDRRPVDTSSLESIYRQHGWNAHWTARLEALRTYRDEGCAPYDQGVSYLRLGNRIETVPSPRSAAPSISIASESHL